MSRQMMTRRHQLFAGMLGISASLIVWICLFISHVMFTRQMPWIVVAPLVAGITGGLVVAVFSSSHQVQTSTVAGIVVSIIFFVFLFPQWFRAYESEPFCLVLAYLSDTVIHGWGVIGVLGV